MENTVKLFATEANFIKTAEGTFRLPAPDTVGGPLIVCVHDGQFHADELVCVALLKLFYEDAIVSVVRSRKPAAWEQADLVIDVGEGLIDHHGKRAENGIAACTRLFSLMKDSGFFTNESRHFVEELGKLVDDVAGVDTGNKDVVNHFPEIVDFNRFAVARGGEYDRVFDDALITVTRRVEMLLEIWRKEGDAIEAATRDIEAPREDERIACFSPEARLADVKQMLHERKDPAVYFISSEKEDDWRVLCCAPTEEEFSFFGSKRLIPEKFRGLRGDELSTKTSIEGGIFCHAAGFIAGFKTRESAVKFAKLCLED